MRWSVVVLVLVLVLVHVLVPATAGAVVTETSTTPYPGITHVVRTDTAIPAVAHILEIDLSSAELRVVTTAEPDRGRTTSDWAQAEGVSVAVNGDLFQPLTLVPDGLAFGGGAAWTMAGDDATEGFLATDRAMDANHAHIEPPESIVAAGDLAPEIEAVVGGRPMLVRQGAAETSFDCTDAVTLACERAPRSAVGLSQDGFTLYLVVVDGWQASSLGLTAAELADVLVARGAHTALAFDPGSSATMVVQSEGGVVNAPSDGVERDVANHVGVRYGMLPPGAMIGFVRERDIFDETASIEGATVTLDDGQTAVTGVDGRYSFTGLTPRLTCATADHPDYHPTTQCRVVPSAGQVYNSIALFPNSDFIDAGPKQTPDASPDRPDADPGRPDADRGAPDASRADGGGDGGSPSACGCRVGAPAAGSDGAAATVACILLGLRAILRARRRE